MKAIVRATPDPDPSIVQGRLPTPSEARVFVRAATVVAISICHLDVQVKLATTVAANAAIPQLIGIDVLAVSIAVQVVGQDRMPVPVERNQIARRTTS